MRKRRLAKPAQGNNRQNCQNAHDTSLRTDPLHWSLQAALRFNRQWSGEPNARRDVDARQRVPTA
jgi:hypothetical protein